ncbi:dimethylarginine dimethylaminohydrolase family protein [Lutimonas sp.]|uniref:dimethylarginine dimethylaminohydrolase family protein n=1 Tax=Lutimonas sp. TaxID=1872403 RepID=UPI003D9B8747
MKITSHSDCLKIKSVMIKPVASAFISQEFISKQWKALNYLDVPDLKAAVKEYEVLESLLEEEGADLLRLSEDASLSLDSVYCRDASIATDFGMIICNMGKEQRLLEPRVQKEFFKQNEIPVFGEISSPGTLEGGDVAWLDQNTLAVGHTYRTNKEGIDQLKALLEPKGVEVMVVPLPHYKGVNDVFHLMSIFSPVAPKLAVVYSPLMPISFRNELLDRGFEFVEVPDEEFESMGCNVLAISPEKCIMVDGNPVTKKRLIEKGCKVKTYKGKHISVMGGGGPTCLTRPFQRMTT